MSGRAGPTYNDNERAMKGRALLRRVVIGLAVISVVAVPVTASLAPSATRPAPSHRLSTKTTHATSSPRSAGTSRVSAILADLKRVATTTGQLTASTSAPGMPACPATADSIRTTHPAMPTAFPFWLPSPMGRCWPATTSGRPTTSSGRWARSHSISPHGSRRSTTSRDG